MREATLSGRRLGDSAQSRRPATLSFGQLLPPFFEDEPVHIEGVFHPLISANGNVPMQHPLWAESGIQASGSTSSSSDLSCWQALWPTETTMCETDLSVELACPPDCTLHSQTAHDASIVLRKLKAFPARYIENWQPEETDDVLYWLRLQSSAASPSSPQGQIDATVASNADPTREDAVLLRLCEVFCSQ